MTHWSVRAISQRRHVSLGLLILGLLLPLHTVLAQTSSGPESATPSQASIAFYYGNQPPLDLLQAFDTVVVEPDSGFTPQRTKAPHTQWLAYVSVGEVLPARPYFDKIPSAWLLGHNAAWQSQVVDQSADGWPEFYVQEVITPLWQQGYRGFFLDTLDSYQLVTQTDAEREQQEAGMIRVIKAIKAQYPEAKLLFNRGFEILPQIHSLVDGVAFESLFRGWNQALGAYTEVSQEDRDWLMEQVQVIRGQYQLPVVAIDYCPAGDRLCQRETARRIRAQGITPYVADAELQTVGVSTVEALPRRVLLVQESPADLDIGESSGVRYAAMPLNYLGYRVDYADTKDSLPAITPDRYAGVLIWVDSEFIHNPERLYSWIGQQIAQGIPVAFINGFGTWDSAAMVPLLNLKPASGQQSGPVSIIAQDPMMGFEQPVLPDRSTIMPLQVKDGEPQTRSLLRLRSGTLTYDAAAITPWGGYVTAPYGMQIQAATGQNRWIVQPLMFLQQALRLPEMPVPDVTSENGRRLMTVHVDGDGFASEAEMPGGGYSGEILLREIFDHYRLPMTMSIVEGEVGQSGLYPEQSSRLEAIAREIFSRPYVEVASHTYSHPFEWGRTVSADPYANDEPFHLPIPGYHIDLRREIGGSIDYINQHLSPDKPVSMVLWPGDCIAPPEALKLVEEAGVLNINGGDTLITRSNPTWTAIAPLGVHKANGTFQVFATNQNENVYTNLWNGPYYGFERVIETWQMTDQPYRFKALNIYYHNYSGTKVASLNALRKVYDYALTQEVLPIHTTDYVRKVLDWQNMAIARDLDGERGSYAATVICAICAGPVLGFPMSPRRKASQAHLRHPVVVFISTWTVATLASS